MADSKKKLSYNVPGEFFVDSTCINFDTCRQLAPDVFAESHDEFSFVYSQPNNELEQRKALRALLACPTGSIGTVGSNNTKDVMNDFPMIIDDNVYYCGFASPKSFGGSSYFIHHREGNWLIDSPKFLPHLVKRFEDMGGLSYIFLTHRDDVADAHKYAKQFGAKRIIHRKELAAQPDAEIVLDGDEPIQLFPRPNNGDGQADFLVIPTPGHTRGHCALLYNSNPAVGGTKSLFSGDHLWWSRIRNRLYASESVCWYDWDEQKRSVERLLEYEFEWVLPGHGQRIYLRKDEMRRELQSLVRILDSGNPSLRDKYALADEY